MKYQLIPYARILFASALISFIILYFAWRRRTVPGARPFFVLMVSSVLVPGECAGDDGDRPADETVLGQCPVYFL